MLSAECCNFLKLHCGTFINHRNRSTGPKNNEKQALIWPVLIRIKKIFFETISGKEEDLKVKKNQICECPLDG